MTFSYDVIVLAGGSGSRLRSQVADRPKCLAEINQRPFLSYILDQLIQSRVQRVILSTGYMADLVEQAYGPAYRSLELVYSQEKTPLGTGGGARQALRFCRHDYLMIINGDSYTNLDLADYVAWFDPTQMRLSLALVRVEDVSRYSHVTVDRDGSILKFEEKTGSPVAGWINAGIYLVKRSLLEDFPPGDAFSLEHDFFPRQIGPPFKARPYNAPFIDIGTPESYAQAPAFFANLPATGNAALPLSAGGP